MAIATFHQWLTFYDETLKSVFPKQNPRVVLAGLRFLQHSPATEKELIQRTGLRQSRINLLLKRLRELGLVERVTVFTRWKKRLDFAHCLSLATRNTRLVRLRHAQVRVKPMFWAG
jgi:DNA-binding MarR family transcriptional regulator